MKCQHEDFQVQANIARCTNKEGTVVEVFYAEIRIRYIHCNLPFEFVGVNAGLSPREPLASPDAQELRAPIRPKGLQLLPVVPGFKMRAN